MHKFLSFLSFLNLNKLKIIILLNKINIYILVFRLFLIFLNCRFLKTILNNKFLILQKTLYKIICNKFK